jgi:hypothetical protein
MNNFFQEQQGVVIFTNTIGWTIADMRVLSLVRRGNTSKYRPYRIVIYATLSADFFRKPPLRLFKFIIKLPNHFPSYTETDFHH